MHFGTDMLHMKLLLFLIYVSDHRAFSQGTLNGCSDYLEKKTDEEKGEEELSVKSHFPSSPLVSKILLYSKL